MKNGKANAWPESSRLLVKMIEMEEVYHSATSPTVGGSVPHRSQSYRMLAGAGRHASTVAAKCGTFALCWRGAFGTAAINLMSSTTSTKKSMSSAANHLSHAATPQVEPAFGICFGART